MAELLKDLKEQFGAAAQEDKERAIEGVSNLRNATEEQKLRMHEKGAQSRETAAPAFESGKSAVETAKTKINEMIGQVTGAKDTLKEKKDQTFSKDQTATQGSSSTSSSTPTDPSASRTGLVKEQGQKVKSELLHAKEGLVPVADHARERLAPEGQVLKEEGKQELSHDAAVAREKAQRAAEVAAEKLQLAQGATAETLNKHKGEADTVTQALREKTGGVLRALGDAVEGITSNAHHTLAAASRTNDDMPADNGLMDGSAREAAKATGASTLAAYGTGKQQGSVALGTTSEMTGKYLDVERAAVHELGSKADSSLEPVSQEVKSAVVSNAEQAKDKHSRLVSSGANKAHKHTDLLKDVSHETTDMTGEKAKRGADNTAAIDVEEFSGINSEAAKPKHQQKTSTTGSSSSSNPTFGAMPPSEEASRSTAAAFPTSTVYPGAAQSLQGDSAQGGGASDRGVSGGFPTDPNAPTTSSSSRQTGSSSGFPLDPALSQQQSSGSGTGSSGLNVGAQSFQPATGRDTGATSGITNAGSSGSSGYTQPSSTSTSEYSTTSSGTGADQQARDGVKRVEGDAQQTYKTGKPTGTVADGQSAAALALEAAKAGKREFDTADGSSLDTKKVAMEAKDKGLGAKDGLQRDLVNQNEGAPTGEGVAPETRESTLSAAKTAGAALKSAVTDFKDKKAHADAATGENQPSKTEQLKQKALEQIDAKSTPEQKEAAAVAKEEARKQQALLKERQEQAKVQADNVKRELNESKEIVSEQGSKTYGGVKDTLLKAHKAKSDDKATKAILQSAERGAAASENVSSTITQALTELHDALSGGMTTSKDTVLEGIHAAEDAKTGQGKAGFVAGQAQSAYSDASSAAAQQKAKAQQMGSKAQGAAGSGAAGGATFSEGAAAGGAQLREDASRGLMSTKDSMYDKAHQGVQSANDPERKQQLADRAKETADSTASSAHSGIDQTTGKAHSGIDQYAPKLDKHGHTIIDQSTGTALRGVDTGVQRGHDLIGTGVQQNEQQTAAAQAALDDQLHKVKETATKKEAAAKTNVDLGMDVAKVFFGKK